MRGPMMWLGILAAAIAPLAQASSLKPVASVTLPCVSSDQIISPSGEQLAIRCKDRSVRLVSIATGEVQRTFPVEPRVTSYNYSHDGRSFAVGLHDGTVKVVSFAATGDIRELKIGPRVETIEFSPDATHLVVGAIDGPGEV